MSKKIKYLTKMSINKKVKSKWFIIANVIILIAISCLINLDSIIKLFGGDFDEDSNLIIIDNTDYVYDDFLSIYNEQSKYLETTKNTKISKTNKSIDEIKKDLKEKEEDILLIIDNDSDNFLKAEVIVNSKIDTITYQLISISLNKIKTDLALSYYNIDNETMNLIEAPIEVVRTSLEEEDANADNELLVGVILPIIILPFFMLTVYLIQMIGAEINEEKSTKSMEIIISNVSPKAHFLSKLLSANLFVLGQALLFVIYALIGIVIRFIITGGNLLNSSSLITEVTSGVANLGIMDKLAEIIPLTLILMLITFIAYSLLAGVLASITTNMEDFQQLQTPIIIINLVGYYLTMMAALFDGSMFIRIMSYVPFISSLLSPALLALGQIGMIDITISIVLSIGTVFLLYKYGLRIYKVGILNYSSNGLWKKMFKAMKNK